VQKPSPSTRAKTYKIYYWTAAILLVVGLSLLGIDTYKQKAASRHSLKLKNEMINLYRAEERLVTIPNAAEPVDKVEKLTDEVQPVSANPPEMGKLETILTVNKEIVGWLQIDGTKVDYPVVQHKDNDYYLNTDVAGKRSIYGSIFMDYRLDLSQPQRNLVIYGHNMIDGSMFGSLMNYTSKDFFMKHRSINLEISGHGGNWEIFSVYTVDASKDTMDISYESDKAFLDAVNLYRKKSMHQAAIIPQKDDEILSLVTCTNDTDDIRLVVHAVKKKGP
jgi:sortase B